MTEVTDVDRRAATKLLKEAFEWSAARYLTAYERAAIENVAAAIAEARAEALTIPEGSRRTTHFVGDDCGHMNDGYLSDAKQRAETAEAEVARLREALQGLLEPVDTPCRFDHHGYCQEHHLGKPCAVPIARAALGDSRGTKS